MPGRIDLFQSLGETVDRWLEAVRDWIDRVMDWFDKFFKPQKPADNAALKPGTGWMSALRGMAVVPLILAVGALGAGCCGGMAGLAWNNRNW